eukprot:200870_1
MAAQNTNKIHLQHNTQNINHHNTNYYNSLENEIYKLYLNTRASSQHVKNRNNLVKFIEKSIVKEINIYNKNINTNNKTVPFGSSVLGIDINCIKYTSDVDYAILIQSVNEEHKEQKTNTNGNNTDDIVTILKNLKQRLLKIQITPDFYNQYKENHYNDKLLNYVDFKKQMKNCNQNRKRLITDRKEYAKNQYNNVLRNYKFGPYSFKIKSVFNGNIYTMPLIKVMDPFYNISMDLCGVSMEQKDKLLLTVRLMNYLLNYNFDDRIRPFIVNIKYWCKMRDICNAFTGFMNSYGYVLMGIKYLQMIHPPILPIITDLNNMSNNKILDDKSNQWKVHQLLFGFFEFWGQFNYIKYGIDICKHGLFQRTDHDYITALMIMDPIDSNYNCASAVKRNQMESIMGEFARTIQLLSQHQSWINCVCVNS